MEDRPTWLEIFSESCDKLLTYSIFLHAAVLHLEDPALHITPAQRREALIHLLDFLEQHVHELCRLKTQLGTAL